MKKLSQKLHKLSNVLIYDDRKQSEKILSLAKRIEEQHQEKLLSKKIAQSFSPSQQTQQRVPSMEELQNVFMPEKQDHNNDKFFKCPNCGYKFPPSPLVRQVNRMMGDITKCPNCKYEATSRHFMPLNIPETNTGILLNQQKETPSQIRLKELLNN